MAEPFQVQSLPQAPRKQFLWHICTFMWTWKLHTSFELEVSSCGSTPSFHKMQNTVCNKELGLAALVIHTENHREQKRGELGKCQMHRIHKEPNNSCSWDNESLKPTAPLVEEGTLLSWSHTAQRSQTWFYQLTVDSIWCAASPLGYDNTWPDFRLPEFAGNNRSCIGKNGLIADETWTWSTCWNEHSLCSRRSKRGEGCDNFYLLEWEGSIANTSQNLSPKFIFTSPQKSLFWKIKRPESFQLIKWISLGITCSCHLIRWRILINVGFLVLKCLIPTAFWSDYLPCLGPISLVC